MDSRVILDCQGAEKLLGKGDMLFKGPAGEMERIQGSMVSDPELQKIADFAPRLNLKTTEKRLNVLKEYKDTIAFMDLPSVSECVDERVKALYEGQVEDFSRMLKE